MTLHDTLKSISLSYLYSQALELKNSDPKFIALGMSGALLFKLYGRKWMSKRLLNREFLSFLKDNSPDFFDELKLQNRILTIGEGLYNLRGIEGIQNVLEKLQSESVDSVIAEIESGRFIFHRGLSFRYVTRSLKKRADFDIQIINGSNEIFCETKCKIETTAFSENSFHNSLQKAKQQLPRNCPAIILIKVPHNWLRHEDALKNIARLFVKKRERPIGVVCWFEKWIRVDQVYTMRVITGFEEHNIKSQIYNSNIIPFLPDQSFTPFWIIFERYASGYI